MGIRTIDVATISSETPQYEQAKHWLADNGIDPEEVPMDSEMVVDADSITYERFTRGDNGAFLIDKGRDRLVREKVTVRKHSTPETYGL